MVRGTYVKILLWIPGIVFVTVSSAQEGRLGVDWLPVGGCPTGSQWMRDHRDDDTCQSSSYSSSRSDRG